MARLSSPGLLVANDYFIHKWQQISSNCFKRGKRKVRRGSREAGGEGGRRRRGGRKNGRKWGVKKTQVELTLCQVVNTLFSEEVNFNLKRKWLRSQLLEKQTLMVTGRKDIWTGGPPFSLQGCPFPLEPGRVNLTQAGSMRPAYAPSLPTVIGPGICLLA